MLCCTLKMLKESETKEITDFFVTFLSLVAFQLCGGGPGLPWLRLRAYIPIPRHIGKGVLIRQIIASHLCTAVGGQ